MGDIQGNRILSELETFVSIICKLEFSDSVLPCIYDWKYLVIMTYGIS